jgi:hypothetical protein
VARSQRALFDSSRFTTVPEDIKHPEDRIFMETLDLFLIYPSLSFLVQKRKEDNRFIYSFVGLKREEKALN